jgi:hypothetical protein
MNGINRRGLLLGGLGGLGIAAGFTALDTAPAASASVATTNAALAPQSSGTTRALSTAAVGETAFNPFLRQATIYSYGHSFTAVPNAYCTPDRSEYPLRLRELIGFADVVPLGRSATFLPDTLALALNGIRATDKDRTWPGLATIASSEHALGVNNNPDHELMPRGVVTIQNYLNETGNEHASWARTPEYIEFWKHCLRSLIAVISSKGQKASTIDVGSTAVGGHAWQTMSASEYVNMFPGGLLFRSNQVGDWRQFKVTGDECWILVFAAKATTATRGLDVYVGSTKVQEINPTGMMGPYTSVISGSEGLNLWPIAVRVSGLNAAAGTTGEKMVQVRVANRGSGWGFLSTALYPRTSPPEVFVAYEPERRGVTGGPTPWSTVVAPYRAAVAQVVSEFANAHAVDLETGWDLDTMTRPGNIHPNDPGQAYLAGRFVAAINETITDWNGGIAIL